MARRPRVVGTNSRRFVALNRKKRKRIKLEVPKLTQRVVFMKLYSPPRQIDRNMWSSFLRSYLIPQLTDRLTVMEYAVANGPSISRGRLRFVKTRMKKLRFYGQNPRQAAYLLRNNLSRNQTAGHLTWNFLTQQTSPVSQPNNS